MCGLTVLTAPTNSYFFARLMVDFAPVAYLSPPLWSLTVGSAVDSRPGLGRSGMLLLCCVSIISFQSAGGVLQALIPRSLAHAEIKVPPPSPCWHSRANKQSSPAPGVGQNIGLHALPAVQETCLPYFYLILLPNFLPNFLQTKHGVCQTCESDLLMITCFDLVSIFKFTLGFVNLLEIKFVLVRSRVKPDLKYLPGGFQSFRRFISEM